MDKEEQWKVVQMYSEVFNRDPAEIEQLMVKHAWNVRKVRSYMCKKMVDARFNTNIENEVEEAQVLSGSPPVGTQQSGVQGRGASSSNGKSSQPQAQNSAGRVQGKSPDVRNQTAASPRAQVPKKKPEAANLGKRSFEQPDECVVIE